ncbi:MAG: FAD:protein FMN transferase, partial [Gammaproteobacteria bacterium]|nr:FAD:protein FMN transferase [Gammaproteobacteria bacterium]
MSVRRFLLLLPALALVACGDSRLPQLELTGSAMGTTFKVVLVEPPETLATDALEGDIVASLRDVDGLASTWRDDSELSMFNANPSIDWVVV